MAHVQQARQAGDRTEILVDHPELAPAERQHHRVLEQGRRPRAGPDRS